MGHYSDQYVDIVSHTHADAANLITTNKAFIASEAYHRHAANDGAVLGTESNVKARLEAFIDALQYNVKAGQNNKVWDYASDRVGGTAITSDDTQDTNLLNYIDSIATQVMRNETVTISAGNTLTQTRIQASQLILHPHIVHLLHQQLQLWLVLQPLLLVTAT